jgi:hypothetical protein
MDRELYAHLQKAGYELIIDEVLETVTIYKGLDPDDLQVMLNEEMVSIDSRTRRLVEPSQVAQLRRGVPPYPSTL